MSSYDNAHQKNAVRTLLLMDAKPAACTEHINHETSYVKKIILDIEMVSELKMLKLNTEIKVLCFDT
jgi:hypothetical protein